MTTAEITPKSGSLRPGGPCARLATVIGNTSIVSLVAHTPTVARLLRATSTLPIDLRPTRERMVTLLLRTRGPHGTVFGDGGEIGVPWHPRDADHRAKRPTRSKLFRTVPCVMSTGPSGSVAPDSDQHHAHAHVGGPPQVEPPRNVNQTPIFHLSGRCVHSRQGQT